MPLLYGEGLRAFDRLQLAIIQSGTDHTIFAWQVDPDIVSTLTTRGVLATTPRDFKTSSAIVQTIKRLNGNNEVRVTNAGLMISLPVLEHDNLLIGVLDCCYDYKKDGPRLGIILEEYWDTATTAKGLSLPERLSLSQHRALIINCGRSMPQALRIVRPGEFADDTTVSLVISPVWLPAASNIVKYPTVDVAVVNEGATANFQLVGSSTIFAEGDTRRVMCFKYQNLSAKAEIIGIKLQVDQNYAWTSECLRRLDQCTCSIGFGSCDFGSCDTDNHWGE
jgi:hypothetical protein